MNFLKLIPPTKEIVELMCSYAENPVDSWSKARNQAIEFKKGQYPAEYWGGRNGFEMVQLYRVTNGTPSKVDSSRFTQSTYTIALTR